ncbi:alpha/beta hydrolase [Roseomonas sp. CCTCC AB2023176]|uniref:alpha/beta hydrolase n=1 Tax=Roseomonas sp. CCTCC AB2023176 TaxID=3342640 RepID=UPI0035DBB9D5
MRRRILLAAALLPATALAQRRRPPRPADLAAIRPDPAMPFAPQLAAAFAAPGRASIVFEDPAGDPDRPVILHGYRPAAHRPEDPVVIVQHGMGRNGDEYRDFWIEAAERHRLLILAPTFSDAAWPGAAHYNNGFVLAADGTVRPRDRWNYGVPARVLAALREAGLTTRIQARIFGHSAGGQYLHRLLSTQPHASFEAATIGNPGWYTLPTLDRRFPEGMGGIGLGDAEVTALLSYPLTILAGEGDIETSGPSLPSNPEAIAQGPHRFARARTYFDFGQAAAARHGIACNWRLVPVPHIGHDGAAMSRCAASLWFEGRLPPESTLAHWGRAKAGAL